MAGHPGSEVGGPAPQHRVEPVQQGFERQVDVLSAPRLHLGGHGLDGLGRGVGVDVAPVGASFAAALDVPSEEVEALVDVGDQGLLRRQAQAHRGQDRGDLLAEGFGVVLGARDEQAPVVCIPRQAVVGQTVTAPGEPLVAADARASRRVGDVLVQHRQRHVAQQRREDRPLRGAGVGVPQDAVLTEDPGLQERLHQGQDAFVPDAMTHPVHQGRDARSRRSRP